MEGGFGSTDGLKIKIDLGLGIAFRGLGPGGSESRALEATMENAATRPWMPAYG